jgi:hypothetical protein
MEEQGPPSRSRACTVAPTGLEEAARSGSAPDDHFITRPDRRMKGPCRRCTSCCGWRYSGQSQGRVSDFTAEEVVRSPAASLPSSGRDCSSKAERSDQRWAIDVTRVHSGAERNRGALLPQPRGRVHLAAQLCQLRCGEARGGQLDSLVQRPPASSGDRLPKPQGAPRICFTCGLTTGED